MLRKHKILLVYHVVFGQFEPFTPFFSVSLTQFLNLELEKNINDLLAYPWDTLSLGLIQKIASQLSTVSEEIKEMVAVVSRVN